MKRRLAVSAFVAIGLVALPALSQQQPVMTAHFIDVGQAHATLLEFPCGAMLIDAGTQDDEHETTLLDYLEAFFRRRADLNRTLGRAGPERHHRIQGALRNRGLRPMIETRTESEVPRV